MSNKQVQEENKKQQTKKQSQRQRQRQPEPVKKKKEKEITNYVQDFIPIKDIRNGLIETTDNRYIKILEIEPINFMLRTGEEQNNIIGTILIFKHDNEYMEIKKFYVRKEYRGKHIGYELYKKAIDFCKEQGVKKIIIGTYNKLESAIKFYIKNDFKEIVIEGKTQEGTLYMEKYI